MKHKKFKQAVALFLSVAMMATVIPNMPGSIVEVQAATPSVTQFAFRNELLSNYKLDGKGTIARIKFGEGDREWLIAGSDGPDTLALLSTSSFENCSYGILSITSCYSDSTIAKKVSDYLSDTSYFSETEKNNYYGSMSRVVAPKLYL